MYLKNLSHNKWNISISYNSGPLTIIAAALVAYREFFTLVFLTLRAISWNSNIRDPRYVYHKWTDVARSGGRAIHVRFVTFLTTRPAGLPTIHVTWAGNETFVQKRLSSLHNVYTRVTTTSRHDRRSPSYSARSEKRMIACSVSPVALQIAIFETQ